MINIKVEPVEVDIGIKIEEIVTRGGEALPWYTGDYTVVPDFNPQVLATANRSMKQDIEIEKIPMTEVSNTYGTTFILGGK